MEGPRPLSQPNADAVSTDVQAENDCSGIQIMVLPILQEAVGHLHVDIMGKTYQFGNRSKSAGWKPLAGLRAGPA
jgi:hypothetical protein